MEIKLGASVRQVDPFARVQRKIDELLVKRGSLGSYNCQKNVNMPPRQLVSRPFSASKPWARAWCPGHGQTPHAAFAGHADSSQLMAPQRLLPRGHLDEGRKSDVVRPPHVAVGQRFPWKMCRNVNAFGLAQRPLVVGQAVPDGGF